MFFVLSGRRKPGRLGNARTEVKEAPSRAQQAGILGVDPDRRLPAAWGRQRFARWLVPGVGSLFVQDSAWRKAGARMTPLLGRFELGGQGRRWRGGGGERQRRKPAEDRFERVPGHTHGQHQRWLARRGREARAEVIWPFVRLHFEIFSLKAELCLVILILRSVRIYFEIAWLEGKRCIFNRNRLHDQNKHCSAFISWCIKKDWSSCDSPQKQGISKAIYSQATSCEGFCFCCQMF